jgi:hypothetical protein
MAEEERIAGAVGRPALLGELHRSSRMNGSTHLSIARRASNHAGPSVLELLRVLGYRTLEIRPGVVDGRAVWTATVRSVRRVVRTSHCEDLGELLLGVLDWAEAGCEKVGTSST